MSRKAMTIMKISDSLIRSSCSAVIYKRGMEYFKEGRVHLRKRADDMITAVVDGENLYSVSVKLNEKGIEDAFCTCPYYETMHSTCKHIVAVLKQRSAELEEKTDICDENDSLAVRLCGDFANMNEKKYPLTIHFTLYVNTNSPTVIAAAILFGDNAVAVNTESFLRSYAAGKEFLMSKTLLYNPQKTSFTPNETEILNILAESCENHFDNYTEYGTSYHISFGNKTFERILALLPNVSFGMVLDGMKLSDLVFLDENPDIIIDVRAIQGEITISVPDKGLALTMGGEYFLHDNIIYKTTEEFRNYFMPIYNALRDGGRTQISFRGENTILFATHILPMLKNRQGVVNQGVDDLIVNERPAFTVYFDALDGDVNATIIAHYGTVDIRIGTSEQNDSKIVVRDFAAENEVLAYFSGFDYVGEYLHSDDDEVIFNFIRYRLSELSAIATTVFSDSFKALGISDTVNISMSVGYNEKIDLLETDFSTDLSMDEVYGILASIKLKEHFYRRSDGSFVSLDDNDKKYIFNLLEHLDFSPSELKNGKKILPKYQSLYLNALDGVEKRQDFADYINKLMAIEPTIPEQLEKTLRFYQKDGVKWIKKLSSLGFGGVLADDMGLGKTLQVLAFVEGENPSKPVLVVTPSALTYNWYNECMRFTPKLKTLIIDGARNERERLIGEIGNYELIITSYPVLRRDIAMYSYIEFSYCFIDEAQYIKNPKTANARSVKRIRAEHKFALTGTPIENSLSELWSIFDFIMSGYLYDLRTFRNVYEIPIVKENDKELGNDFKAKIKPFILRRMKSEVLSELPEKMEYTVYADLTSEQRKMYMSYLTLAKNRTVTLLNEGNNRMQILTLLMRLRQICCHPALFDDSYTCESGKLQLLTELVENAIDSGHRLLIFSQYTSMLEIIRSELGKKNIRSFYLDGKTPSYERSEMADRFNGGERDVFLISLRAGGTGLNLTGADMVIHYDPWWNPATMDQASDRAYRIGQKRDVQVIRLAAKGTIEEKILKLQEVKRSLANDIISVGSDAFFSLSNEEILALFE